MFSRAYRFSEGLAVVVVDNKFGYIDRTSKFVIEPQFTSAESFSNGLAMVFAHGKSMYIALKS
jgi:hypothetical protein